MKKIILGLALMCFAQLRGLTQDVFSELVYLYTHFGSGKYMLQEEITQINHVLQAAYIAEYAGAPEHIIIGLLFHDIGQIVYQEHLNNINLLHHDHDELGAAWLLERGFPLVIVQQVRWHTLAKVVLCDLYPHYFNNLSLASKISYEIQYKKYSDSTEYKKFMQHPLREAFFAARMCDDMAKIVDFEGEDLPGFEHYREMVERVLAGQGRAARNPDWIKTVKTLHQKMCDDRWSFEAEIKDLACRRSQA